MKITFLCPHLRIAGGVRAILIHADRLARRGHEVTVVVPGRRALTAWWRNRFPRAPEWIWAFTTQRAPPISDARYTACSGL